MSPTNLQEAVYDGTTDYTPGSPHLSHRSLNRALLNLTFGAIESATAAGLPPRVLEVGGGDGSITEPLLAKGLGVWSTEMSLASIAQLEERFGANDRFRAVHDADGDLTVLGQERFSSIVFASVVHHIPDYLTAIEEAISAHLSPGGSLVTIQDPLYYPRMRPLDLRMSSAAYLSWRVFQGGLLRGVRTRWQRTTKGLSDDRVGDAVEYHVVRDGVDERAIVSLLTPHFERVEVHPYWSSQGAPQQWTGEKLRLLNTFALVARGYRGASR